MLGLFSSGNFGEILFTVLVRVFIVICILPVHEFAHAFAAHKLGDDTAKWNGRLTLNPMHHLDVIGSLALVLAGIGWAKPVPVNPYNFKNRKAGMAITAFAGPLSNIMMGLISLLVLRILFIFSGNMPPELWYIINLFFSMVASINISLAIFNLVPCPPLDGSRIVGFFLPERVNYKIAMYERYIWLGLIVVLVLGVLDYPLAFLNYWVKSGLWWLVDLPFSLLGV
ncbi:MAG: site-2 protease family protein [Clostridiales bacterium]|nr:site-2 protease family protein [Clostridiales bacterium]